jgi:hypothetical protein
MLELKESSMPIIGVLEIILQAYFAVHAGRTGRYGWIFIILFFPLLGSIIYFFVEYLPEIRTTSAIKKSRISNRPKSIKLLQRELEITDSPKNRLNLAEAYFYSGRYQAAIELLEKSLTGIHENDLSIIEGLIHSHFQNGTYDKAIEYLDRYESINESSFQSNLRLLRAKAYEAKGDLRKAMAEYKSIVNTYTGEEARCRYAVLLKQQGYIEKAKEMFAIILKNADLYPKQYATYEKEWVKIAKSEIR